MNLTDTEAKAYAEKNLESVKSLHPQRDDCTPFQNQRSAEYVAHAEAMHKATQQHGARGLLNFWKGQKTEAL